MHYVFLYTEDDKRFKITYTDIPIQINKVYLHITDYEYARNLNEAGHPVCASAPTHKNVHTYSDTNE